MFNKLNNKNFSFTGSKLTEEEAIKNGYKQLSGKKLKLLISNKTVFGDYPIGYIFIANIYQNGITKGINNVGSSDIGNWSIDYDTNSLRLKWKNSWKDTLTKAYDINGNIEFFDVTTGNWRSTFKIIETLK